jgi:hypothetical protein
MPSLARETNQSLDVVREIRVASSELDEVPEIVFARVLKASVFFPGLHPTPIPAATVVPPSPQPFPMRARWRQDNSTIL